MADTEKVGLLPSRPIHKYGMKLKDLVSDVWSSKKELKPLNLYSYTDAKKAASSTKVEPKTVTIVNQSTGEIIGKRTIHSK